MSLFSFIIRFLFNLTAAKYAVVGSLLFTAFFFFFIQPVLKYVYVLTSAETQKQVQEQQQEKEEEDEEDGAIARATPSRVSTRSSHLYATPFSPSSPSQPRRGSSVRGSARRSAGRKEAEEEVEDEEGSGVILSPNRTLDLHFHNVYEHPQPDLRTPRGSGVPHGSGPHGGCLGLAGRLFSFLRGDDAKRAGGRGSRSSEHADCQQVPLMVVGRQIRAREGERPSQVIPDVLLSCVAANAKNSKNTYASWKELILTPSKGEANHHRNNNNHHSEGMKAHDGGDGLEGALRSGEVFYSDAPSRVLTLNERIHHMVETIRRRQAYELQTQQYTRKELAKLYETPEFQQWYAENRDALMQEVDLRQRGILFRRLTCLIVLIFGVFVLPCLSFGVARQQQQQRGAASDVPYASMTMAQLLSARRAALEGAHPVFFSTLKEFKTQKGVSLFHIYQGIVAQVEIYSSYVFTFALCVTPFMPRRSLLTALFTIVPFLGIVFEIWQLEREGKNNNSNSSSKKAVLIGGPGALTVLSIVVINVVKSIVKEAEIE